VCGEADEGDVLLLCVGCDNACHLGCARPMLRRVPKSELTPALSMTPTFTMFNPCYKFQVSLKTCIYSSLWICIWLCVSYWTPKVLA
jgi:hypothetical protein